MKMSRLMSIAILGAALALTPVYAQRGGGGHSNSSSVSRGGGGFSSSSRSGSSFSSSSRSSSSSSRSSFSSSSRSSSPSSSVSRSSSSSRGSYSSGNRSSFSGSRSGISSEGSRSEGMRSGSFESSRSGSSMRSRTGSVPNQIRSRADFREGGNRVEGSHGGVRSEGGRSNRPTDGGVRTEGRPHGIAPAPGPGGYARPGHPGHMPPSHRPMHPAPYFWHPHHHCMVHCHRLYWDPFIPRPLYWPGFWLYCDSYWYDYHVTDVFVVREYVRDTYKMDLITYAISGNYMYALVNDPDGHTYIQIYDKNDKLLAEQQVSRKYCKMEVDPENGGCWIMKKRDKDPLLFFYTEDGQLLIYEAD